MFYLNKPKTTIVDGSGRVVGFISGKLFTQDDFLVDKSGKCAKVDVQYRDGLTAMELEHISELMQREVK